MKSIKFNNQTVTITYETETEAQKSMWIFYNHEREQVTIEGNTITFKYVGLRFLDSLIRSVFAKTCAHTVTREFAIDKGTTISHVYTITATTNHIFRITYINKDGTIGKWGFGCWQYGRILSIEDKTLTLRNSNMDETKQHITFDENDEGEILIEIGEIQF